jgi:hypothetical protein
MLVPQFPNLALVLILLLLMLIEEVLFLGLNDYSELGFFAFHLLYQLLQMGYLLKVLDFLRCNFLVELKLLLLVSNLIFNSIRDS